MAAQPEAGPAFDGPGAMAALTAWLHDDPKMVARLFDEALEQDAAPMLFGLGYLATAAIQAYAETAGLTVEEVLHLLGTLTARRAQDG